MFLIFDTETTGLPKKWKAPLTDFENWPRMVQLAWQCHDVEGNFLFAKNHVIIPEGYIIPDDVVEIHGISTEIAKEKGIQLKDALRDFVEDVEKAKFIIGHNVEFDINIVGSELLRCGIKEIMTTAPRFCTKIEGTAFCAIRNKSGGIKAPTLTELHLKLFNAPFPEAHNAAADVVATSRCFLELIRVNDTSSEALKMTSEEVKTFRRKNPSIIKPVGIEYESFKVNEFSEISIEEEERKLQNAATGSKLQPFVHLHVHSQYSILDGAASTAQIARKAKADGMLAVAITDHGGMFGVKEFHVSCKKNDIKPIIGIEVYVARRGYLRKEDKTDASGNHLILLAKNYRGYQNLLKLTSIAYTEGMYYKPRIDKELLEKYKEGIIVSSACLGGEVAQHIMAGNFDKAKETIQWFKSVFGDDYYLEIMRHKNDDPRLRLDIWENQVKVNKVILNIAKELSIKVIATNDTHFINPEDADAHDVMVCLNTGRDYDDPTRMRYTRQEWFKTTKEMNNVFADVPETLANTLEIANKVEEFELNSKPIMPDFPLPEGFESEADYLRHLTIEGAKKRYGDPIPEGHLERINFELDTIINMGFPGYFLITQDFINWAKDNGVLVGPGRGSAAGSVVAYSTGITNIDPMKYDLLFERFLNPDRISMPDVDIDFDDDGRQLVLDYVTDKYGRDKVAHICTFGTMATKSSIKDVARVLKLDLSESNRIAKLVPEAPKMSFEKAYKEEPALLLEKKSSNPLIARTIQLAEKLEGSIRHTGVHACGVLIGKNPLDEHLPVMPTKGEELLTTQYDGRFVEDIGLLKMDFLGLKTLSIIKDVIANIKLSKGIDIDIDNIELTDEETFKLFSRGETTAIFQFESPGMKKHLRALQPNRFEDLVAMNALYRPGPMEYIPSFINRKHGKEKIEYDHPKMEPFLSDTYGITVYQEQVMLQSRALGGFTRGDSDSLRKAMGKKKIDMMNELKLKFTDGCLESEEFVEGCTTTKKEPKKLIDKIWTDWEAFASYAFNKSHSVCYAYIAYQTGYLKAHYPAEFMSGVLSRNLSDITKITSFMEECRNMGMEVLGPDVNESYRKFTVNKDGAIRFGMAGIKGVGEGAVDAMIQEREANGPFKNVYDYVERNNLGQVNKKNMEALVTAGALDNLDNISRGQYFATDSKASTLIENLVRYGNKYQNDQNTNQQSLFGGADSIEIAKPEIPSTGVWQKLEQLKREKEVIGIFLSAHPLDDFKLEIDTFCNVALNEFGNINNLRGRDLTVAGIVTDVNHLTTKTGKPFGFLTIQDFTESYRLALFGKDYENFRKYCYMDYPLLLKGKVQARPYNEEELEFKIKTIMMLTQVREEMVDNLQLTIPLKSINQELIDEIKEHVLAKKGKVTLKFKIIDPEENIGVELFSRTERIDVTNELIDFLNKKTEIQYSIS
ncbi:MAG: DNA polymerase III subunit alpha [Bacteroidales bacterium]|nr:DNA polymerase III subunit alpha [Bacteroidales bacterium]